MKLERIEYVLGHKTGTIQGLTATEIWERLGKMDEVDDDEAKVKYSWAFTADGVECGIWDYYGSGDRHTFSTFGPHEVFIELFGANYTGGGR